MSNLELFSILSKPWLNVNDIMKIGNCGKKKATEIRNSIEYEYIKNGKKLPSSKYKVIPNTEVIQYFNLDIDFIYHMAEKEKNIYERRE